jgi:geranylgeranyl pyrophosphate synthase
MRTIPARARQRALRILAKPRRRKTDAEIAWLLNAMVEQGSIAYGRKLAREFSLQALEADGGGISLFGENEDRCFLREMLYYVIDRTK